MNRKNGIRVICIILAVIMALSLIVSVIPIIAHAEQEEPSLKEQLATLN